MNELTICFIYGYVLPLLISRDYVDHFQPHQLCFDDYFQAMENK